VNEPEPAPALLVETPEALASLARRVEGEPRIALDTEANSLHAFRERVCVVQLSVPGLDAIVDPLAVPDLSPLAALVDRDEVEVVFHGGDYDVSLLSRDHGFRFRRVFDTMIAATLLGDEKLGLAALVEAAHGVVLSKKHQKSDWARRPFTPPLLEYLRDDTRFLLDLHDRLARRLVDADLVEEAAIEFRRLAARRGAVPGGDPEAWRALRDADRLDDAGRATLHRLWAFRDERARAHDVPRFRVLLDATLVELAGARPRTLDALGRVPGTTSLLRAGDGDVVLQTIADAESAAARGDAPPRTEKPRRSPEERARLDEERKREERLRRWRKDEALRRGVPNVVVLPNPALLAMAASPPSSPSDLLAMPDVGGKRVALYGDSILRVLRNDPPAPRPPTA
jgi:ribonuclease D